MCRERKGSPIQVMASVRINRTAGSQAFSEVCDKGKPGESRRRKATRLKRVVKRQASRAAESHYRGGRMLTRTFILAVTGCAVIVACGSYGTSIVEVGNTRTPVASVSVTVPLSLAAGQTARAIATPKDANGAALSGR